MAQIILDSNNNLIQGDFDNATINNRTKFKTTTTNATTNVYAVPNGSATSAGFTVTNAADPTNASKITIATNGSTDTQIISGVNGSGTYLPMSFYVNNTLGAQLDTSGNFYATGKMGGVGSVIQVVQGSYATQVSTSSSTYSDTGITATITPSSASNKILVFSSVLGCMKQLSNTKIGLQLVRNSTTVSVFSTETGRSTDYGATAQVDVGTISSVNLDSPASTSALTYKIQFASVANTSNIQINNVNGSTVGSTITLMEIKA